MAGYGAEPGWLVRMAVLRFPFRNPEALTHLGFCFLRYAAPAIDLN